MTATDPAEPAPPQRGLTRDEQNSAAQAEAEAGPTPSKTQQFLHAMSPRLVWSQADGYPVVVKQFIQFCLILIYPAWVFMVLVGAALTLLFYVTIYPILWVLFWPIRASQKKNHPEEYAESQRKK
ncbi:hypothetical protein [Mycobacterium sp. URHB0044]|jgi:hypothetical protein|uniref:hypothetical protein n=1 Tax=Mycobacterium sp. URHB0044 TaxID=1380386 RepID=UPI00048CAB8E|nr:hypothetical protein [Mycobacterium sp. URHB0044]